MYTVFTRDAGGKVRVLGHLDGRGQQCVGLDETIEKPYLIEALGGEAKSQRHLCGNGVRQAGDKAVIVATQQPTLGLRHLEDRSCTATRRSVRSTSWNPPPMA